MTLQLLNFEFPYIWENFYQCTFLLDIDQNGCTEKTPKIRNKYSQERNRATSVPIPTLMFLWAIYIFLWLVYLFWCRKISGPNVGICVDLSQTQECGNRDWGRAIPFVRLHKFKFFTVRYRVSNLLYFALYFFFPRWRHLNVFCAECRLWFLSNKLTEGTVAWDVFVIPNFRKGINKGFEFFFGFWS
jgi:hypothetical protein